MEKRRILWLRSARDAWKDEIDKRPKQAELTSTVLATIGKHSVNKKFKTNPHNEIFIT